MASQNHQTLEAMWETLSTYNSQTPDSTIQEYTEFFTPTATVYLSGMGQPPTTSHESLIAGLKTILTYYAHVDRKVIVHTEGEDGTIVNAMENKITILGELIEGFAECEVVTFKEGKIEGYRLYVDPAPIMAIFAKKTEEQK